MSVLKKLYAIVSVITCLFFAGCLEVEEQTTFKTANTGDYTLAIDMGKMIAQLKMFGAGEQLGSLQMKDTTIYFKDFIDKDTILSLQDKDLIRNGVMKMNLNPDDGEMKLTMSAPFTNPIQLNLIRSALFKMLEAGAKPGFKSIESMTQNAGSLSMLDLNILGFTLIVNKGIITNKLSNPDQLKTFLNNDSTLQQIKQLAPLMGATVSFKNVYTFATPIKNFTATNGTISENRKTIIIKNELNNLFENPASFEFTISY